MRKMKTNLKYKDVNIDVLIFDSDTQKDIEESINNIEADYNTILNYGFDKIVKDKLVPWLKGNNYLDRDDNKVFEGLKVVCVSYRYQFICAKYSPTQRDDYFGEFQFDFKSASDYTNDMFECCCMHVYIKNNVIVKVCSVDV